MPRTIGSRVRSLALVPSAEAILWSISDATASQMTSAMSTMASAFTAPRSRRIHSVSPAASALTSRPNASTSSQAAPMMTSARKRAPQRRGRHAARLGARGTRRAKRVVHPVLHQPQDAGSAPATTASQNSPLAPDTQSTHSDTKYSAASA